MKWKKRGGRRSSPQRHFTDAELAALNPDEHPGLFRKVDLEDPLFKSDVMPHALRQFAYIGDKKGTWRSVLPRAFYLLEDAEAAVVAILKRAPQPPTDDSVAALAMFANAVHAWGTELLDAVRPGRQGTGDPRLTIAGLFKPAPDSAEAVLPSWSTFGDSLTPFLGEIPAELRSQRQLAMLQDGLTSLLALLNQQGGPSFNAPTQTLAGHVKFIGRSVVMALQGLVARLRAWLQDSVANFKEAALPRFEFTGDPGFREAVIVVFAGRVRRTELTARLAQLVRELFKLRRVEMFKKYKSAISDAIPELEPYMHPLPPGKSPRKKKHLVEYQLDPALYGRLTDPKNDGKR
jgi:hypothetical protein